MTWDEDMISFGAPQKSLLFKFGFLYLVVCTYHALRYT